MKPSWSFLIVAAGSGSRIGGTPKQFRLLGGIPLWKWSALVAERLWCAGEINEMVVVLPKGHRLFKHDCLGLTVPIKTVEGGPARADSVANGLEVCSGSHVLVHDGDRPFLSFSLCMRLKSCAQANGSAVPLLKFSDSLKKKSVVGLTSVNKDEYMRAQTPQAFERFPLIAAISSCKGASDEAASWTGSGRKLFAVEGEEQNFKITTRFDWLTASALVSGKTERRVGHGYDVHELSDKHRLVLAGLEIKDSTLGLLGHSDADIVAHAVMDALLGAAGEPAIGTLFPSSDERWAGAYSMKLLENVVQRVRAKGWIIEWVDATLTAQKPRLGPFIPYFVSNMTPYLREESGKPNFNMKVKSGEGVGSVGRCECMICHAVASLKRVNTINEED